MLHALPTRSPSGYYACIIRPVFEDDDDDDGNSSIHIASERCIARFARLARIAGQTEARGRLAAMLLLLLFARESAESI